MMMKKFLVQLLLFCALTLFLPIAAAALCGTYLHEKTLPELHKQYDDPDKESN